MSTQRGFIQVLSIISLPILLTMLLIVARPANGQTSTTLLVEPGDTWHTLAWRLSSDVETLQTLNQVINTDQQPAIGSTIVVPTAEELRGALRRVLPTATPSLIALGHTASWSDLHDLHRDAPVDPFSATYAPILVKNEAQRIAEAPPTFRQFELSHLPAVPGEGMAYRGTLVADGTLSVTLRTTTIEPLSFDTFVKQKHIVGLRGTGAFYPVGTQVLDVDVEGMPLWSQPWLFASGEWEFQDITFTGAAARIDNAAIAAEGTRMFALWSQRHPDPFWRSEFQTPIAAEDIYAFTSGYGARRSYNGGPYSSYHEGVDYAAFEGVSALATTEGIVILAEPLYVRGGAVILDHGLGIYSGYYHLSEVTVNVGDIVAAGEKVGGVGTTGLSTGNHLHWDFLVTETWVGADKWSERGMGCWVLEGLGIRCWSADTSSG